MTHAVIVISTINAALAIYFVCCFSKAWTNLNALNDYAIASFERLVRLEAIIDDILDVEEETDVDEA